MRARPSFVRLSRYGASVSDLDRARERADIDRKIASGEIKFEPPVVFDALTLPMMQQAALLMMTVSQIKWTLVRRLLADSEDRPRYPDFGALVALGLAEYKPGKREHDLTDKGRDAVRRLEPALCLKLDVHLLTQGKGLNTKGQRWWKCPCGFSTWVRASGTAPGNARSQHHAFVATRTGMGRMLQAMEPRAEVG